MVVPCNSAPISPSDRWNRACSCSDQEETMRKAMASLAAAQGGFTGAEKALMICFGLAVVAIGGSLVMRGSGSAATDARRALADRSGGGGKIDGVVQPMQSAGKVAEAKEPG